MARQIASPDEAERKRLFNEVQKIFAEHLPIVYFVAPRIFVAHVGPRHQRHAGRVSSAAALARRTRWPSSVDPLSRRARLAFALVPGVRRVVGVAACWRGWRRATS